MLDSPEELLQHTTFGEDTSLELKAVVFRDERLVEPRRDDLADEIGAIANTTDDLLVLGVDDKTHEVCHHSTTSPLTFRSIWMERPGRVGALRAIVKIEISRSSLMDNRGEGVPIIITETRELSRRAPIYEAIDDSDVLLTILRTEPPGGSGPCMSGMVRQPRNRPNVQ